ncbi:MAG: hypothetical protein ABL891_05195 [Burkholderiales bacterium]
MRFRLMFVLCLALLPACVSHRTSPAKPDSSYGASHLIKTDLDRVTEAHQQEIFASLRLLAERLYRRNPRELGKSGQKSVEAGLSRIFDRHHGWQFEDLDYLRGAQAIQLAFREDYRGDRVLAYVVGLASMIQVAFNNKTEFFVINDLDPQGLHNAARNVEIALWKLSNTRTAKGDLFLLSNEITGPVNLSVEREFGKVIASLDVLSKVLAGRYGRTVVKVVQSLATAVFLPIR